MVEQPKEVLRVVVAAVAGAVGNAQAFPTSMGGNAGDGTASSISGTSTFYAAGAIGVGVNGNRICWVCWWGNHCWWGKYWHWRIE
jgi:hypothetical protein